MDMGGVQGGTATGWYTHGPVELDLVKSLLLSSVSFESAVITCELEDTARERRANKKFEGRHERRAFEGRAAYDYNYD